MRSWHHRQLITAAAACAAGALSILPAIPASVASASPRPIRALPLRLPPDAAIGDNAASLLVAIDCVRPRSCTAGGGYANRQNRLAPMVASQVSGRWRRAIGLALPPNSGG